MTSMPCQRIVMDLGRVTNPDADQEDRIELGFVRSGENLADLATKTVPAPLRYELCRQLLWFNGGSKREQRAPRPCATLFFLFLDERDNR